MRDAAHESRSGHRDEAVITLLYDTGLRRGELHEVDRDMLDLDERELRIPRAIGEKLPEQQLTGTCHLRPTSIGRSLARSKPPNRRNQPIRVVVFRYYTGQQFLGLH